MIAAWKIAPALAMGNTVVKPASVTPLTALALADLAVDAGLPEGVLNVISGSGSVAGNALVNHPLVRKISFTGSTEVGKGVMKQAADGIKRVSLNWQAANRLTWCSPMRICMSASNYPFGRFSTTRGKIAALVAA